MAYLSHSPSTNRTNSCRSLAHGGVEASLHVLGEQFKHEGAFLVVGHHERSGP